MPHATVKEVMTRQAHLIDAENTILQATLLMRENGCGALPVGYENKPVGMVTARDIVVRAVAEGLDPNTTTVKEVMTPGIVTCYDDDTLEQAADVMGDNDVRRLIVLDHSDQLVGVLSDVDVIKCPDSDNVNDEVLHHLFKYA